MEEWKDIPEYCRYYQASTLGNIRSVRNNRILKPSTNHKGYFMVVLCTDVRKTFTIHSLIALTYHGKRPTEHLINHKNGIKKDNRPVNLEYATRSQNELHAHSTGLKTFRKQKSNYSFSNDDIRQIRNRRKQGILLRNICADYNCGLTMISMICNRKCYDWVE